MGIRWLMTSLAIAGCGRVGFDATTDGATDGAVAACTPGPWSNITPLTSINGNGDEWEPALHPDGTIVVWVSYTGSAGMYVSTRASTAAPFGPRRMIAELSTGNVEHGPFWSSSGDKLYFSRDLAVHQPMFASHLGNGMFSAPEDADFPTTDYAFALSADELELFSTEDLGGGDLDLHRATRTGQAWEVDTAFDAIDQPDREDAYPALDDARGDLYYQRESSASTELVVAHRSARGQPFGAPTPVPGLQAIGSITGDPSLTADGLTIAFASDRPGDMGASDLYIATRSCP